MKFKSWLALVLILCLLLSGCTTQDSTETTTKSQPVSTTATQPTTTQPTESSSTEEPPQENPPQEDLKSYEEANPWDAPRFEDMEYIRPDPEGVTAALDACTALVEGSDSETLLANLEDYMVRLCDYITNYWLAYIRYNLDLSDEYWEQEHNFCTEHMAQLEADMDVLMHALADSAHRDYLEQQEDFGEGFFDDYEGESLWTDRFTQLMEQENDLQTKYFALAEENENGETMELLVDMILLRQQIAEEAGYEDYPSFAYDFTYQRDYTVEDATAYLQTVRQELVPLYLAGMEDDSWMDGIRSANSKHTLNYVEQVATAMGGTVEEAFQLMTEKELYHMRYGYNKMAGAFTAFLPGYMTPFVFMNPTSTTYDYLTMTHEFGHFSRAYAVGGDSVSIDMEEIFSQGLENLSLCYGESDLAQLRMFLTLSVYVEQGAFADFELQIYNLEPEEVTVENVRQIFQQTMENYGLEYNSGDFVEVHHFFISPLYVISYVTSNDAALQLYQMELAEPGSGVACYNEILDSDAVTFLAFLEEAGLESPFTPGRIEDVRKTFESIL